MTDVARHAGVSLGTVSNTLNSPEKVSDATRRRVLASIAELGFVRNDAARSLAAGTSSTVGLVVADLGNSFFVDIARGAEQVLRRQGMNLLIANTDIDPQREVGNLETFERARVAGIILAPLDTALARTEVLPVRTTPTVFVNWRSDARFSSVAVDEGHGGALAASHLLSLGRRRLLYVGGPLFLNAVRERYEGVQRAVAAHDDARIDLMETRGLTIRHGREAGLRIIEDGAGRYDGIVAPSDLVAVGLVQAFATQVGFSVPGDIAITGYDDNHFASESAVPITTISQPGEQMGSVAAELLLERIAEPGAIARSLVLEPHLIPRASTLPRA
ncbi:LacI family DNA-binding transcriptional regulator [Microbacterium terrae]|uniref:Ribose operon repressor n=1 Tax=Microbacterium terrae TaxID=69369 RepID=A0A0M2H4H2_9MICO|nr:LacI family DNA-binding transcriptional regulator [Microbacterium terrae]KJL38632.1 Ribose operon repressor [Microbacterium terrae]GLJ96870.1 LacI family transcriptional regulator [Microbacterium terrae]